MSTQTVVECSRCGGPSPRPARLRLDMGETHLDYQLCAGCVALGCAELTEVIVESFAEAGRQLEMERRINRGNPIGEG